ncbi:hypothetical protein UFOVP98_22 [uncultured Caudovirales phage]|jgi:hypothetical protein|uniref:Uncharacterized protein n=1 Tax=uncultured Caudovirales phage TaxID=2100421 RepID=A0A6J5LNA4_9CAUD|nr:hypothetical protein UFOVP98_22 [uncultured Caudovirales phage]CAB4134416.1 hypothetical protein UFOVP269_48 [uncultured Caudovirales phage]
MRDRKNEPNNTPKRLLNPAMEKALNEAFAKVQRPPCMGNIPVEKIQRAVNSVSKNES